MPDRPAEAAPFRRLALETAGLAVAYLLLGRLGLLLAIPPGYATAIFPPAGLALHRMLRRGPIAAGGVFLGSYLLNLSIAWSGPLSPGNPSHLVAACVAGASTLQALVGAWLVRRVSPDPMRLDRPRDLLAVLGIGGPVSCLTAATLANAALWKLGILPTAAAPYAWWTWWVGDALGVVIFVPALQMLTSQDHLWRERRLKVGLPMALALAAVVGIFVRVSRSEEEELHRTLRLRAEQARAELVANLQARTELLHAMSGLVKTVPDLKPDPFRTFVDPYLRRYPDVHSVDWVPRVPEARRASFERELTRTLGEPFEIRDMGEGAVPHRAGVRPEYWPVTLKHPLPPNRLALGLDLKERPFQGPLMVRSRDDGATQLVILERLAQDAVPRPAMVLTMPVYPGDRIPPPEARAATHLGFVSVLFYADPLLAEAADRARTWDVNLSLRAQRSDGHPLLAARTSPEPEKDAWMEQAPLELYGAHLTLEARPTPAFFYVRKGWQVFLVLAGGLGFTGLMGALLLLISGEVSEAKGLAEDRGRALATVEARSRVILDHAVEPILTLDATGHVENANRAAQNLLGWDLAGLHGRPIAELVPGIMTHLRSMTGSGSIREAQGFPRSGEPIPLEVGLNAVEVEGRVIFTAFLRDLRDRRRLERIKNELIAVVSHELRTPLTSIRGTLGLLEGGVSGPLPEKAQDLVRIAHQNARHLGAIVDDILDLEKLERGQLRLDLKVQALAPLLEKGVELNQGFAARLGIALAVAADGHPEAQARVDGGRLVQVLGNLLSNALKHSPQGGTVTVALRSTGETWCLEVRDQGPGVPMEFAELLFEKFTQADTSEVRKIPGTGLGLAISRALIEGMGGAIGYRNEPEGGATFYVELPRA